MRAVELISSWFTQWFSAVQKEQLKLNFTFAIIPAAVLLALGVKFISSRCCSNSKTANGCSSNGAGQEEDLSLEWFGPNRPKEAYQQCLEETPENHAELKKLLFERAREIVRRIRKLREEKEALGKLFKSGSISQTMWDSVKDAEQAAQLEVFEVQAEADTFDAGWGEVILQEAANLMQESDYLNAQLRELKKRDPSLKIPETEEGKRMLFKRIVQEMKRKGAK